MLYINDLVDDFICNIANHADDIALYLKSVQVSGIRHWNRQWVIRRKFRSITKFGMREFGIPNCKLKKKKKLKIKINNRAKTKLKTKQKKEKKN